jgi:hypothetical protein
MIEFKNCYHPVCCPKYGISLYEIFLQFYTVAKYAYLKTKWPEKIQS